MVKKKYWLGFASAIFIIIIIFTSLCTSTDSSSEKQENHEPPEVEYDTLYIGTDYLLPDPPGPDKNNKTELLANNKSTFGHNIRDRKYNDQIDPSIYLWLNTKGKKGLSLEFEITFQMVEDNTVKPDKKYKISFDSYVTKGNSSLEIVNLTFSQYDGKPFDIKYGNDNWCMVYLTISRIDNKTDSKLLVFSGANDKISYIKIPYDRTLSSYEYEKEKEKDNKNTPGFSIGYGIAAFVTLLIFYLKSQNSRFKN
jgi:hypothetical protein